MSLHMRVLFFIPIFIFGMGCHRPLQGLETFTDSVKEVWPIRLEAGYSFGKFIGIRENYSDLELFIIRDPFASWEPFLEFRASRFDSGKWASNVGVGVRSRNGPQTYGMNVFYDYQRTVIGGLHRFGLGLELFEEYFDLRLNTYFPIDDLIHGHRRHFNFPGGFKAICTPEDYAFKGIDGEVGMPVYEWCGFEFYGAMGPYYYHNRKGTTLIGAQARLECTWTKYLTAEAYFSWDNKFSANIQGRIELHIPLTKFYGNMSCCVLEAGDLFTQSVDRNNLMFLSRCCSWQWNWDSPARK
jgi:Inverse autotransporter, beta-domain